MDGKLSLNDDRPGGEPSIRGSITIRIAQKPADQAVAIAIGQTAEVRVMGGFSGKAADAIAIDDQGAGAVTLQPASSGVPQARRDLGSRRRASRASASAKSSTSALRSAW